VNYKRALIATTLAVPVIALFAWGLSKDPGYIPSPLPGKDAPQFSLAVFAPGQPPLNRVVGDSVRLGELRGQVVVLNFWASWCLACRDEHTTLSDVARRYAGRPVHFLGVLYNDQPAAGVQWISEMGGQSYPSVNDPNARTAIDFGLYGVPETFFLDVDGRVAYKNTGPVTDQLVSRIVDSLMAAGSTRSGEKSPDASVRQVPAKPGP
jgi:cytochrome c biogenesis protein CcmG/thiol:disulfide interchange protein DsbE